MKKLSVVTIFFTLAYTAVAQGVRPGFDITNYGVRIEPDKRLVVVLATLEMARSTDDSGKIVKLINTPLSEAGLSFRQQLEKDNAGLGEDLRQKISIFVAQHKRRHPGQTDAEIVAPFISMAYTLSPVPELADPLVTTDLPGNLLDVLDFSPLVREFYRRSGINAKLDEYVKIYQAASDVVIRPTTSEMVSDLLTYLNTRPRVTYSEKVTTETQKGKSKKNVLRKVETVEHERKFVVVPELLAPKGGIQFLNIRDDYFVIVPTETNLTFSDARRAFLQYVFDSLVLENGRDISTMRPGITQLLDERRKTNPQVSPDVFLAVSRSLVAAADARQLELVKIRLATQQARARIATMKTVEEKKAVSAELERFKQEAADDTALKLSEDYEKGAVLAFYFSESLKGLENSGFDVSSSMREMILSFDAAKETSRLEQFAAARERALAAQEQRRKNAGSRSGVIENPVTVRLLEIRKTIDDRNYVKADSELRSLLQSNPDEPRILYNLGRVASLSAENVNDPEAQNKKLLEAKSAYEKVIAIATQKSIDPALRSLTYVALAKIYEFYDDPGYAVKIYDEAIKIGPVADGAFNEAMAAKQRLLKNQ